MADRFTKFEDRPWVSSYVPLPLDYIKGQIDKKDAEVDAYKKSLGEADDEFGKLNTTAGVLGYGNQGGMTQHDLDLNDRRKKGLEEFNTESNQLASDLQSGKIGAEDFKYKSAGLISKTKGLYNDLKSQEETVKSITKNNEELAKRPELSSQPYLATDVLEYNRWYVNERKKNPYLAYVPPAPAEKFNIQDALKDFTFKDRGTGEVSYGDKYITTSSNSGVAAERVKEVGEVVWENMGSKPRVDAELQLKHEQLLHPEIDFNKIHKYPDGKGGFIEMSEKDRIMNNAKSDWMNGLVAEHAGEISKITSKVNPYNFADEQRKKDAEANTPLAGTVEATLGNPGFNALNGIPNAERFVETDANGNKQVNFSKLIEEATTGSDQELLSSLWTDVKVALTSFAPDIAIGILNKDADKVKTNATQFRSDLKSSMVKAAKVIGYQKPVTEGNYGEILQQADQFNIQRGTALDMTGDVGDAASKNITTYSTAFDFRELDGTKYDVPSGASIKTIKREPMALGDKRVSMIQVQVTTGEGSNKVTETKWVREPVGENRKFYDNLVDINDSGMQFIAKGGGAPVNKAGLSPAEISKFNSTILEDHNNLGLDLASTPKISSASRDTDGNVVLIVAPESDIRNQRIVVFKPVRTKNGTAYESVDINTNEGLMPSVPISVYMQIKDQQQRVGPYNPYKKGRDAGKTYDPNKYTPIEGSDNEEGN